MKPSPFKNGLMMEWDDSDYAYMSVKSEELLSHNIVV